MKESEKIKLAAKTVLDALYKSHKAGDKKRSAELDQAHGWLCKKYLEAKPLKITIQDAIKANTVIHCETEEEADRILKMAESLGYKWCTGENYENNTEWSVFESKMCYDLFEGSYSHYDFFKNKNYTIISSIQIADVGEKKSTDSSPASLDIEATKVDKEMDKYFQLKREVLTILSVESKLNPDKKISEYLEQFRVILEVL